MAEMLASLSITCSFCQRTVGRGMKLYEIVNVFEGDVNLVIGEMKNRLQQHIGCTCSGYAKGSLSSADITDACLATLIHYWGETGEITPEHAWECINNEKEKAETQRKHAHEIFALEKAGAGDATADDANDAHEGGEQRIKRRRKKPGASPAAALTDIMGKQGNNAMAASSSSTSGMQMTTLKACTGAMVQPKGTYPAAPDPGHVAQASQALQTALSAAMDGSRSRGTNPSCAVTGASFSKSQPSVKVLAMMVLAMERSHHMHSVDPPAERLEPPAKRLEPSANRAPRFRFEISAARRNELLRELHMTDLDKIIEDTYTWPS
jgi:hypothetical protein